MAPPLQPAPAGGDLTMRQASDRTVHRALGVIGDELTGVTYVRFDQPFRHLREHGFELSTLGASLTLTRGAGGYVPDPRLLDGVALLIFPQMIASPRLPDGSRLDVVEPLCDAAAARGIPIVYSVDDALDRIETHNPAYETIQGAIANLGVILARSDALIVTTPELARRLAGLRRPTHLLPNAIEPRRWTLRPRTSGELRVGWSGSASHLDDLLLILPAIRRLQERIEFRFVLHGLTCRPIAEEVEEIGRLRGGLSASRRARADAFLEMAGILRAIRHRHVPFGSLESFFKTLPALDLDIGLCPLLDTPFNRHKSALKFYEYAAAGSMTIASAVPPYASEVSALAANTVDAWRDTLERYLGDREARETELRVQREFVLAERSIERLKSRWAEALTAILAAPRGGRASGPSPKPIAPAAREARRA
ncbi:MAG TPA: hypothetical protein VFT43_07480 [Candidatus Polarisedimenticolia bacterium]|nr:hypothetical protein [Candidatus Polarisedimenticolia bacterium]